jgi:hypothetical protein
MSLRSVSLSFEVVPTWQLLEIAAAERIKSLIVKGWCTETEFPNIMTFSVLNFRCVFKTDCDGNTSTLVFNQTTERRATFTNTCSNLKSNVEENNNDTKIHVYRIFRSDLANGLNNTEKKMFNLVNY